MHYKTTVMRYITKMKSYTGLTCVYEIYHHIALLMLYTVTIMSYYHSAKHGQARDGRSYHYHSIPCTDEPPLRAKSMVSDARRAR